MNKSSDLTGLQFNGGHGFANDQKIGDVNTFGYGGTNGGGIKEQYDSMENDNGFSNGGNYDNGGSIPGQSAQLH